MLPTLKIGLWCLLSLLVVTMTANTTNAAPPETPPDYQLAISFDLARNMLTGTARIMIDAGETLTLHKGSLTITGILLKRQDGSNFEADLPHQPTFSLPAGPGLQEVYISYFLHAAGDGSNLVTTDGITLLSDWYPVPEHPMHYQLSATLPEGFTAVTESNRFPLARSGNTVTAAFSSPQSAIHFAAARYTTNSLEVREGLKIYTLFFPEDADLAHGYLVKSREYIMRYEQEIGPFPYNHYVVVANRNPTGLGMPTFTLLGQSVLRLPFIKDTSLGHEILHSWFGNSIDVDPKQGNWCEGLTAYLSDHAYRQDQGEGAVYRKDAILNYLSYVHANTVIPLSAFTDAGHAQPLAEARRAVGYSRGMMFFHELHELLGHDNFARGIRSFYAQFRNSTASWDDILDIFNAVSTQNLSTFFTERLSRTDIPAFHAENISISQKGDDSLLQFTLVQETTPPYSLNVPVKVTTAEGIRTFSAITQRPKTEISLPLPGRPLNFSLDPEYSLLRHLAPEENSAVWSKFIGSGKKLVILQAKETMQTFQPLLQLLQKENPTIKYDHEITNAELRDADLLILGLDQQASRSLFGSTQHPKKGFTLDVRHNPLNPDYVAILVSSSSEQETAATASRLSHYGKYGYLHFQKGRASERRVPESVFGRYYQLEQLPVGAATRTLDQFDAIAAELSNRDVIYIGESHTSASDHRLQLRLLEALAKRVPDLAIGMEMFPDTSQKALDAYVLGDTAMSEKEFLKASRYFEVWQYDYRYFREIFQFARKKHIPVIGLNLERETVSTVYRTGSTDELPSETLNSLPPERDLDMSGYGERLRAIHTMHEQGNHGDGVVSGFIQAQAIWDEGMATRIVNHLRHHPGRKMLVMAGTQHTRKDSGIPPRVARRIKVDQASVLNIANNATPVNLAEIADYFFISEPIDLDESPKMGIVLKERETSGDAFVEIIDFSPESKAGAAGLQKGDILRAVDGYPIATMADIRISMVDAQAGDALKVQVERPGGSKQEHLEFEVELIRPEAAKPHP